LSQTIPRMRGQCDCSSTRMTIPLARRILTA
jgi:hypothetical protein